MLKKLLKHDLISLGKELFPLYFITLLLSIFTRITTLLGYKFEIFQILAYFISLFALLAIIALVFITFSICVKRFYNHIFKAEGYLTNILPVTKKSIINSKIISTSIHLVLSFATVIISLVIIYYDQELISGIAEFVKLFKSFLVPISILIALSLLNYYLLFLAAYSSGQKIKGNKIRNAVLSGIIIYIINQIISFASICLLLLVKPNLITDVENNLPDSIRFILWFAVILSIVIMFIYYKIINYSLHKQMDIE